MIDRLMALLGLSYPLTESEEARRSFEAAGMAFEARGYAARGFGHVGVMTARGPMRLETLVLNPFEVDAPILSCDRIHAMGREILMAEMYDSLLGNSFRTDDMLRAFPEQAGGKQAYWYAPLIVAPGLDLKGSDADAARFDDIATQFASAYLEAARAASPCEPGEKRCKAAVYSEGLLEHGGPATDPVKAAMGEAFTAALFRQTLFGA